MKWECYKLSLHETRNQSATSGAAVLRIEATTLKVLANSVDRNLRIRLIKSIMSHIPRSFTNDQLFRDSLWSRTLLRTSDRIIPFLLKRIRPRIFVILLWKGLGISSSVSARKKHDWSNGQSSQLVPLNSHLYFSAYSLSKSSIDLHGLH